MLSSPWIDNLLVWGQIPGGGGLLQISSDDEVQLVFWVQKFTILGFFWGKKIIFGIPWVDCKNAY